MGEASPVHRAICFARDAIIYPTRCVVAIMERACNGRQRDAEVTSAIVRIECTSCLFGLNAMYSAASSAYKTSVLKITLMGHSMVPL